MTDTTPFDVVGPGYVAEHHIEEQYRHRVDAEDATKAVGPALAWLVFYAIAILVVALSNANHMATAVVAALH